jgi:gamma-glutamyl-gamma-aminobutyrate hydrolase PuuD
MNVFYGGTLLQHLDGHRQSEPGDVATERVTIKPGSRLAEALGCEAADVNQFHHQAIARVGEGLRAVAWAEDGVIEAVEDPNRAFVVGVQWHAEGLIDAPEQLRLFTQLAAAAAGSLARR